MTKLKILRPMGGDLKESARSPRSFVHVATHPRHPVRRDAFRWAARGLVSIREMSNSKRFFNSSRSSESTESRGIKISGGELAGEPG
jgi:hypothetical protein